MKPLIVVKQADTLIPEEYLDKVLALGPTCAGIAAASVDDKGPVILLDHMPDFSEIGDQATVLKEFMSIQTELQKHTLLMHFSPTAGVVVTGADGSVETPNMQPFQVLSDGNDRIQLVTCLSGDYSAFTQEKSENLPEFFALQEDLIPRLMQVYGLQGERISKLMDHIRGNSLLIKDLKKLSAGDTGVLTLFASDGDLLTLTKKDGVIYDMDWGWTTDSIEGVLEKQEDKPVAGSRFSKLFGARHLKTQPKAEEKPVTAVTVPETLPDGVTRDAQGVLWAKAPNINWSKNQKKDWYLKHAGFVPPQNIKNCPKVEVKTALPDVKDLKQLDKVIASVTPIEQKPKNVEPAHIAATIGLAPAAEKAAFQKDPIVLKYVDKNGNNLIPFEQFKEEAGKMASFSEQSNIHLAEVRHWPKEMYKHLVEHYPNLTISLVIGLVADKFRDEEATVTTTTTTEPEKKVVNGGAPVASNNKFKAAMEARKAARM